MEPIKIIWHDPNAFNPENSEYIRKYLSVWENRIFTNVSEAVQFLSVTNNRWILVTSGTNGEDLIKKVHNFPAVLGIIIFCRSKDYHRQWSSAFSKVKRVENTSFQNVVDQAVECWNQLVTINDICTERVFEN